MKDVLKIVVAVILGDNGKMLLQKRGAGREFPNCWEMPGGKVESGEDGPHTIYRELMEELGVEVFCWPRPLVSLAFNPPVTRRPCDVSFYLCTIEDGVPQLREDQQEVRYWPLHTPGLLDAALPSLVVFSAYLKAAGGEGFLRTFMNSGI